MKVPPVGLRDDPRPARGRRQVHRNLGAERPNPQRRPTPRQGTETPISRLVAEQTISSETTHAPPGDGDLKRKSSNPSRYALRDDPRPARGRRPLWAAPQAQGRRYSSETTHAPPGDGDTARFFHWWNPSRDPPGRKSLLRQL